MRTYRQIKFNVTEQEPYLSIITNPNTRQAFTKLRISDHKLQIEIGRHCKPPKPINERICQLCADNCIEDEIHFLIDCKFLSEKHSLFLHRVSSSFPNVNSMSSREKFIFLMSSTTNSIIILTANYIYRATNLRFKYLFPPT